MSVGTSNALSPSLCAPVPHAAPRSRPRRPTSRGPGLVRTQTSCDNPALVAGRRARACAHPVAGATPPEARFSSPDSDTPRYLAEKILTSMAALEGERKQVTVPLRRPQRLDGAARRPRPRGSPSASGSCAREDDGGCASLQGHRELGDGRRDHGAVRCSPRTRGPCNTGLLRGAPDAGEREEVLGRGATLFTRW
jgi:hypothetical protein